LKRNPYYWRLGADGKALPFLDGIVTEVVPDLNAVILKFKSKETDYVGPRPQDWADFQAGQAAGDYKDTDLGPAWGVTYLTFNMNPDAPKLEPYKRAWFSNQAFRQAVSYALDRDSIVKSVLHGLGRPLWSPVSEANKEFYDPNVKKYPLDVAKAKSLLEGMGFKPGPDGILQDSAGHPLEFTLLTAAGSTTLMQMCNVIQDNLKQVGMKVDFTPIDFNTLVAKLELNGTHDWDAVVLGFTGGVDPHGGKNIWSSDGQLHEWNPGKKSPPTSWEAEIDKIYSDAAQTTDQEKRKQLYNRWQEIAADQLPLIYLATADQLMAQRNKLVGTKPTALGLMLWNAYEISEQ
jgi:peptide/nickel transport system substrate-binding protein